MPTAEFDATRGRLKSYFDGTAREAWARLTSDAPVSRIRATVRAGRDAMRATLLEWLGPDLTGRTLLDAGCGAGQLSTIAAARGADVLAVDVAGGLVDLAAHRAAEDPAILNTKLRFATGDMLDPALGRFDHVVAMDSLIHYAAADMVAALANLAERTERSILFTVAPRTPALAAMHAVGKLFPRGDRAPAIAPIANRALRARLAEALPEWRIGRDARIARGFYVSHAMELMRR